MHKYVSRTYNTVCLMLKKKKEQKNIQYLTNNIILAIQFILLVFVRF